MKTFRDIAITAIAIILASIYLLNRSSRDVPIETRQADSLRVAATDTYTDATSGANVLAAGEEMPDTLAADSVAKSPYQTAFTAGVPLWHPDKMGVVTGTGLFFSEHCKPTGEFFSVNHGGARDKNIYISFGIASQHKVKLALHSRTKDEVLIVFEKHLMPGHYIAVVAGEIILAANGDYFRLCCDGKRL